MERSRNEAGLPAYIKVVQGAMKRLDPDQYNTTDMERFCDVYEEVMVDLLHISARPTRVLLKKAAEVVFQASPSEAGFWAERVVAALSYCRQKKRSVTTGKKTGKAALRIMSAMQSPGRMSKFARKEARALRRRASETDSAPPLPTAARQRLPEVALAPPLGKEVVQPGQARQKAGSLSRREVFELYGVEPDAMSISGESLAETVASSPSQEEEEDEQEQAGEEREEAEGEKSALASGSSGAVMAAPARSPPLPAMLQFLDSASKCMVRVLPSGERVAAIMVAGPNGFARAVFPGEAPVETEMPNLLLGSVLKRPAAASREKQEKEAKDAKQEKEVEEETEQAEEKEGEEEGEEERERDPVHRYTILYYKNGGRLAMRRTTGDKKQIFSIGCKGVPRDQVQRWFEEAKKMLQAGTLAEEAAQAWILERL